MLASALKTAKFDVAVVRESAVGGGIIPVARRPDGTICLLLAKEQYVSSWRGSHRWSGFEGGRKPNESIEQTSIREWREESLDAIQKFTVEDLTEHRYVLRYTLNISHARRYDAQVDTAERYHVTYLMKVDYDDSYIDHFQLQRRRLLAVSEASSALKAATNTCTGILKPMVDFVIDDHRCCFHFQNGASVQFDSPFPQSVKTWIELHRDLQLAINALGAHEAVTVTRTVNSELLSADVNPDYLEKEVIRWWTLGELKTVLRQGGKFDDENFRSYFLPVQQAIVTFLDSL